MFYEQCGNQILNGAKFCTRCGTPVHRERVCPNCQNKLSDSAIFCAQCGMRVDAAPQAAPVNSNPYTPPVHQQPQQPQQAAYTQQSYQNTQKNTAGFQPQKYSMISKFVGEPTAGIAKATGTMTVYADRLEYSKTFGNALGNAFGLVGMAVSANKAKQDGKVEIYHYHDIKTAYVGKYMAVMPSVVLLLNDGQVFSFNGTFSNQAANKIVNIILRYKGNV